MLYISLLRGFFEYKKCCLEKENPTSLWDFFKIILTVDKVCGLLFLFYRQTIQYSQIVCR